MLQNMPQGDAEHRNSDQPLHVLLCPDQPSWAFDNIANNISRYAGANKVSKLYMRDVIESEHLFFEAILLKRIDLCHIFWREDLFFLLHPGTIQKAARRLGFDYEILVRAINSCAFTTSVYDHLFSSPDEIQARRTGFALVDGYTVSSWKLEALYAAAPNLPPPDVVITDGVDTNHFAPGNTARPASRPFAIGWVGNSAWGKRSQGIDIKGYHRLFEPMTHELRTRGYAVEAKVADPQVRRVHFEDMPDFYRELDIFVCTSAMEGTPNPVLEAMSCGIPVVSTDVGIVPEVFGAQQKQFIIPDPSPDRLAGAVALLLDDEHLRRKIAAENRSRALAWSWQAKTTDWWPFWQRVVMRSMKARQATRRELYLLSAASLL